MITSTIPSTQRAVQLTGPDQLQLTESKPVPRPGPYQILARVEVCGLCFSDLKLLKQFDQHPRKSEVRAGLDQNALFEIPSYVPGKKPTVPGHETVVRVVAVGDKVRHARVGGRYLVQTDYRWLPTAAGASAFGYNFEGALQEYVLMDERAITAPDGESMLIPVPENLPASALALCEPWACVEDAYVDRQRQSLKPNGRCLIVGNGAVDAPHAVRARPDALPDGLFDDVIYFGHDPAVVERLFPKIAPHGLLVLVQSGGKFGRPVTTAVGKIHYGPIRIAGTTGHDVRDALATIPATAEIRPRDKINIVGAAGPMGQMHVIRNLCQGVPEIHIYAGDLSDERLQKLEKLARPLAERYGLGLTTYNPSRNKPSEKFTYIVLMAPVPALVAEAVLDAAPGAIINIFAGIPADKTAPVDLDQYIAKRCYFIGTSGSTLDDLKAVLRKVVNGQLDTNLSVAAVSGLDGAIDGIRAVEKNTMPGKIIVYPSVKGMGLTPITELIGDRQWDAESEQRLLQRSVQP